MKKEKIKHLVLYVTVAVAAIFLGCYAAKKVGDWQLAQYNCLMDQLNATMEDLRHDTVLDKQRYDDIVSMYSKYDVVVSVESPYLEADKEGKIKQYFDEKFTELSEEDLFEQINGDNCLDLEGCIFRITLFNRGKEAAHLSTIFY